MNNSFPGIIDRKYLLQLSLVALWLPFVAVAEAPVVKAPQNFNSEELDLVITQALEVFQVPGMAVGVIKDGEVIYAKGHGVLEAGKSQQVDEKTLFGIASNGKAFTAAAIALLVDDGVLSWDDRVVDHLTQFQMYCPHNKQFMGTPNSKC